MYCLLAGRSWRTCGSDPLDSQPPEGIKRRTLQQQLKYCACSLQCRFMLPQQVILRRITSHDFEADLQPSAPTWNKVPSRLDASMDVQPVETFPFDKRTQPEKRKGLMNVHDVPTQSLGIPGTLRDVGTNVRHTGEPPNKNQTGWQINDLLTH